MEPGAPQLRAFQLLAAQPNLDLPTLVKASQAIEFTREALASMGLADPMHPYGRRILMDSPVLEVMVATWTDDMPCIPHDHGGAIGAVRVLSGSAEHRIWTLNDGKLSVSRTHTISQGDILSCGPHMIHSMCATDDQFMTLHMYTRAIDHMVIYDVNQPETMVINGGCGAWIPENKDQIYRRKKGFHSRKAITHGMSFSSQPTHGQQPL